MGYFDADAQAMLEVYLLETKQLVEQLNTILLQAEQNHVLVEEDIHGIFRIMHTIKSSSAMMGLSELSSMAHKLEDLFAYLRDQDGDMAKTDRPLFNLLFAVFDYIENEMEDMVKPDYHPGKTSHIEALIQEQMGEICQEAKEKKAGTESSFREKSGIIVRIRFEIQCKMEHIRAFMVMNQIRGLCSVCESSPGNPEKHPECGARIREEGFLIRFESSQVKEVLRILNEGLFVETCEILEDNREQSPKLELGTETESVEEPEEKTESEAKTEPMTVQAEKKQKMAEFLNVRVERLDTLQNLTGEMMVFLSSMRSEMTSRGLLELEEQFTYQSRRLMNELEETVMGMRMVPVRSLVPKLRRILRDICSSQDKEAELVVTGEDAEADKVIVEHIFEASMHIMRNALDHGIEVPEERERAGKGRIGKVWFHIESSGGTLTVSISDDGRGIDEARIREKAREKKLFSRTETEYARQELYEMLMLPGLSTAEKATEYSGRGVGLDVVKKIIEESGGHLHIESEQGRGTRLSMYLPITVTTMDCVRFRAGNHWFLIPHRLVCRFFEVGRESGNIRKQGNSLAMLYEGHLVPVIDLREYYHTDGEAGDGDILIYVRGVEREACFRVDHSIEQERVVLKPLPSLLGRQFRSMTGISGCSIMGDGTICFSLDVEVIMKQAGEEQKREYR